jgi:hypothetical protein
MQRPANAEKCLIQFKKKSAGERKNREGIYEVREPLVMDTSVPT